MGLSLYQKLNLDMLTGGSIFMEDLEFPPQKERQAQDRITPFFSPCLAGDAGLFEFSLLMGRGDETASLLPFAVVLGPIKEIIGRSILCANERSSACFWHESRCGATCHPSLTYWFLREVLVPPG
jgi:hypothetical protein